MFGKISDIVPIISENIWHDQHDEKKLNASFILTGTDERYIEKPAKTAPPAIAPTTNGAIAPADNGKKVINTRQKFFNHFIVLSISYFAPNVI